MHDPNEQKGPSPSDPPGQDGGASRVIPVVQEEASISRVAEETGAAVRVRIEPREERGRITATDVVEETSVERVPINRFVTERTPPREEGEVVIVPVFETVAVVETRLLLKEEVRITRRRREVPREEEVVLRRETPIVERRESEQDEWRPEPPA